MAQSYKTIDEVLNAVGRPGWRIVGLDPQYTETTSKDPDTGKEVKNRQQTSTIWSIQSPDGVHIHTMEVHDVVDPQAKGGVAIGIVKAPTQTLPAAPAPSTVSAPKDQRYIIERLPDGTLRASENPNFEGTKSEQTQLQVLGSQLLRVNPDNTVTVIATKPPDPKQPTAITHGEAVYSWDGTGPPTLLLAAPPDKTAPTTKTVNGKTFQWNPATRHWDESGLPVAETTTAAGEIVWQDIPETDEQQAVRIVNGQRAPVEGLTRKKTEATTLIGGADSQVWTFVDKQGNVVRTVQNPNYKPPPGTALTPDTVSEFVPALQPDGTIKWTPNQNRVAAGQAMQDLLAQVGIQVDGGQMSMTQAKDLLSGAVSTMTARTTAATGALSALQEGARTGAGLLQQRVSSAQGMLNTVLGLAGQGQASAGRYGTLGGGLQSVPAGLGAGIVGGITGWTRDLMGGQSTLDTAARLVRSIDPTGGESPLAQAAYGVLTQMLDRYGQTTGQPHPLVAATQAAAQTQGTGGMVTPVTAQPTTQPTITGFRAPSLIDLALTAAPARGPLMG